MTLAQGFLPWPKDQPFGSRCSRSKDSLPLPKSWGSSIAPVTKRSGIQWGRVGLAATSMALAIRWKRVLQAGSYSNPKNIALYHLTKQPLVIRWTVHCSPWRTSNAYIWSMTKCRSKTTSISSIPAGRNWSQTTHAFGSMEILQETKRFTIQMWLFPLKFPQQKMENTSIKHNNYGTMGLRITTFCELMELWSCHATWTPPDPTGPHLQGLQQDIPILWKQFHALTGAQFHQEMEDKKGKTWQI